jgi:arylsulfatase
MKYSSFFRTASFLGLGFIAVNAAGGSVQAAIEKTNFVVILADDLGFSDLGCYGGEIQTPNLDRLAANGLRFTQFHNTARCWPSRAALLTGYYAQQVRRDKVPGIPSGNAGKRPTWARLAPDLLRSQGYRSYHSGKWHVDGTPIAQGFDRSYHLEDAGRNFHPQVHFENDKKLAPVKPGSGYYSSTAIAEYSLKYLDEHQKTYAQQPFFLYMAFVSPHFPLQAPTEDIAKYRDKYKDGWEVARAARWKRQQKMGLIDGKLSDVERQVGPPYDRPKDMKTLGTGEVNRPIAWNELTAEQKDFQAKKMEIHAAMVDRIDQEVGRVIDRLKAIGQFDNTMIMFLSDNGASAEIMVRDDGHDFAAAPGSAATHLCLGPGWSSVANTPFRRHKTWVHEGGIATPLVVHWPKGVSAKGEIRHDPSHLIDLLPTFLEISGAQRLESWKGTPVPAAPGKSLVSSFKLDNSVHHDDLWWEHEGHRAIRKGDWKLVSARGEPWELFKMSVDPTETNNLVSQEPQKARELELLWQQRMDEMTRLAKKDLPQPAKAKP